MSQFKRAQCILLPTNKAENALVKSAGKLYFFKGYFTQDYLQSMNKASFHLYLLSDDEIKEGDWYYNSRLKQIFQAIRNSGYSKKTDDYKIIATTDTSLIENIEMIGTGSTYLFKLPQPSQQFIEKYIESYNAGQVINDVLVEYSYNNPEPNRNILCLKVNSKDNTITIKKVKENWNREEVIILLNKLNNTLNIGSDLTLEQWIEKNL